MYIDSVEFRETMLELVREVRADICNDYWAFEEDGEPGIQLTVATDENGEEWNYQTGDNSYSGGAYCLPHWAVIGVYRDTDESEAADDIIRQLGDLVCS